MNMYTVMRNPSTVWIKRASTWNRVWALVLASPGTPYIAAARKEKKNQKALLFFLSLRCFLPLLYGALVFCVLFKVCKRCCLERKKNITAAMYAFPCDATRVHRGALSLDTNTETSCPHLLPSLTTSCNVIYKPSSSRVGILFFFHSPLAHSRCSKNQRTPCVPFCCRVFSFFFQSRWESVSSQCIFFFDSFATVNLPVTRAMTAWHFFCFALSCVRVYVCAHVVIVSCQWLIPVRCTLTLSLSPRPSRHQPVCTHLSFFLFFRL